MITHIVTTLHQFLIFFSYCADTHTYMHTHTHGFWSKQYPASALRWCAGMTLKHLFIQQMTNEFITTENLKNCTVFNKIVLHCGEHADVRSWNRENQLSPRQNTYTAHCNLVSKMTCGMLNTAHSCAPTTKWTNCLELQIHRAEAIVTWCPSMEAKQQCYMCPQCMTCRIILTITERDTDRNHLDYYAAVQQSEASVPCWCMSDGRWKQKSINNTRCCSHGIHNQQCTSITEETWHKQQSLHQNNMSN